MNNFTLSAFADEIHENLDIQIKELLAHDIYNMELRSIGGKNVSEFSLDETKEIAKTLKAAGISVSAIGSPIGKVDISGDFSLELERFKRVLEIAITLQSKYIRMFTFWMPEGEDPGIYKDEVILRWEKFLDAAKGSGVTLLSENEKGIFCDTAKRSLEVISALKGDAALTFDPANFVQCGENVKEAISLLLPYVKYVHIKDALSATGEIVPAGYGDGDVPLLLQTLKGANYQGFLSLEPHLANFAGFKGLENDRNQIQSKLTGIESFDLAVKSLKKLL